MTISQIKITATPLRMQDMNLRPRRWVYGDFLLRGEVSLLAGVCGRGRRAIATTIGLAVATGRPLLGQPIPQPGKVVFLSLRPGDEGECRLHIRGSMIAHGLSAGDLTERLLLVSSFGRFDADGIARALIAVGATACVVTSAPALSRADLDQMKAVAHKAGAAVLALHTLATEVRWAHDETVDRVGNGSVPGLCRIVVASKPKPAVPGLQRMRVDIISYPGGGVDRVFLEDVALGNATSEYPFGDDVRVARLAAP